MRRPPLERAAPALRTLILAIVFLAAPTVALAADPKLLEPERAFAFSVQALDGKTLEARFAIAPGYYLYREKLKFAVEPGVLAAPPGLPPGKIKEDQFFGKVETYRGQLAVKLPVEAGEAGRMVTVRAESQGCADAGVCYPPQAQAVTVRLPLPGAKPDAPVAAAPARKSWFN